MPDERDPTTGPALSIYDPEPVEPRRRDPRHRRKHRRHRDPWRQALAALRHRLKARWKLPLAVVAIAVGVPTFFFVLRAWVDGDAVVVDRRAGLIAPGPVEGAVHGGVIEVRVPSEGVALPPGTREARVQLRLSSWRRSRILLVSGPRGPFDVRPVWPEDGTCFDLGPLPAAGTTAAYRVRALWPEGRWGLTPAPPLPGDLVDVRLGGAPIDYRVVAHVPVGPLEALARLTFFLRISSVALACLGIALVSLVLAVRWWLDGSTAKATGAVMVGMAMLFVATTPPFQAADESTHTGTLEYVIVGASHGARIYWPASMAMATSAIGLDDVRFRPEHPLPVLSPEQRDAVARVLALPAAAESRQAAVRSAGQTQEADEAPLFYPLAIAIPVTILGVDLGDRLFLYRALVVSVGVAMVLAALTALVLARLKDDALAGALLVFLVPQWLGIAASATPYSPGLGASMLATCLIVGSMTLRRWTAFVWLVAAAATAIAGGLMIRENFLLAPLAGALAIWRVARPADRGRDTRISVWLRGLLVMAVLGGVVLTAVAMFYLEKGLPANLRTVARLFQRNRVPPDTLATLTHWLPLAAAPLLAAGALIWAERRARRRARPTRRWLAVAPAVAVVAFLVGCWLVFPDARVPTSARIGGMTAELFVRRVVKALAVTAFSWDQDFIAWKTFFGALGWHDLLLPPVLYALARWTLVGAFLAIPFLFVRCARHDPREAGRLLMLLAAGVALLMLVTFARSAAYVLHGRYLLFAGPLLGIALCRLACLRRGASAPLAAVFTLLVVDLWLALYLVPCRYLLAGAGLDWARVP